MFTGEFTLTPIEQVISGPGSVAEGLARALDRRGCRRALIVTGQTLSTSPLVAIITQALGDRFAGIFSAARQHVPASSVGPPGAQRGPPRPRGRRSNTPHT